MMGPQFFHLPPEKQLSDELIKRLNEDLPGYESGQLEIHVFSVKDAMRMYVELNNEYDAMCPLAGKKMDQFHEELQKLVPGLTFTIDAGGVDERLQVKSGNVTRPFGLYGFKMVVPQEHAQKLKALLAPPANNNNASQSHDFRCKLT